MGTLVASILASLLVFFPLEPAVTSFPYVAAVMVGAFLLAFVLGNVLTSASLQTADRMAVPRIIEVFRRDRHIAIVHVYLLFWSLVSLWLAVATLSSMPYKTEWVIAVWLVLTGLALDLASYLYDRVLQYLNPFAALQMLNAQADREMQQGNDAELCSWIESTTDAGVWSLRREGASLANATVDSLRMIVQRYLGWNGRALRSASSSSDIQQRASYILHYTCDRLALLHDIALEKRLQTVCSYVVSAIGKIALSAAKSDPAVVAHPVQYMGQLSRRAVHAGLEGAGLKALSTFVALSKLILSDPLITQRNLDRTFVPIIHQMEDLAKESFRRNKDISLSALIAPLQDLKRIFENERYATHQDTPMILKEIERVLGDFANLELVLRTIPSIPEVAGGEDTISSAATPPPPAQ